MTATSQHLTDQIRAHGGFTYSITDHEPVTSGYAVSDAPERTETGYLDQLTADWLDAFVVRNVDRLWSDDYAFGGWVSEDRHVVLDVVRVETDRDAALKIGKEAHQIAIYDLDAQEEITV